MATLNENDKREPFLDNKRSILYFVGAVIALLTFVGPLYFFFWSIHLIRCLWKKEDPGTIDFAEVTRGSEIIGGFVLIGLAICIPLYIIGSIFRATQS